MDTLITIVGFFIGIALFLFLMQRITAIVYNCSSVVFTFLVCWGIGIILAWIAWKIALIIGVIALAAYLISKFKGSGSPAKKSDGENASPSDENAE